MLTFSFDVWLELATEIHEQWLAILCVDGWQS